MSLTADPADVAAWERRPTTTLDAFQLIADGVTAVGGFGVAAISVVRGPYLVVEAVSGSEEARAQLQGTRITVQELLDEISVADDWGAFRFLPHDRIDPDNDNLGWVPDLEPLDVEDAWHPLDLLVAPLCDAEGEMVGMLSIDLPVDGRRPGPEQRRILDAYAQQASRAALTALEGEVLAEQVRLADAAREIVRNISTELSLEALLEACNEAVVDGFGAVGLWIQTFDSLGAPGSGRIWAPEGIEVSVPDVMRSIAEFSAHDTWRRQTVDVVRVGDPESLLPDPERDIVYAYLAELDVASMLFVPLGAGQECVGALSLTRGPDHRDWSPVEVSAARDIGLDIGRAVLNARTYERERELVAELQALDTYKSRLVSTLSHELKNPLTSIGGHLELLEILGLADTEPQARVSLDAIDRGVQRLRRLVGDLMMLAKVGDPATPLIAGQVDLVAILEEVSTCSRSAPAVVASSCGRRTPAALRSCSATPASSTSWSPTWWATRSSTPSPAGRSPCRCSRATARSCSRSPTPASASPRRTRSGSSPSSSGRATPWPWLSRAPAWASPSSPGSSPATAGACSWRRSWAPAARSASCCRSTSPPSSSVRLAPGPVPLPPEPPGPGPGPAHRSPSPSSLASRCSRSPSRPSSSALTASSSVPTASSSVRRRAASTPP